VPWLPLTSALAAKGEHMRNLYTVNEIIVCAYIARFGRNDFKESDVVRIKNRSLSSIKMKV
jgi:hypothetical protein